MKQLFLSLLLMMSMMSIVAQEEEKKEETKEIEKDIAEKLEEHTKVEGWHRGGVFSLMFNQSSFTNWVAGGDNTIAGNASINYDANLVKNGWTWDNKFILSYGLANSEAKGTIKTDDRIEINSLLGKKAGGYWYYSFFANFLSQFANGYDYEHFVSNDEPMSSLFAPAYISFGPGMLWKKSDNFKVNIAPATSKVTILGSEVFTYNEDLKKFESSNDISTFGVEAGETSRYEIGLNIGAYHKIDLMKNISMENILNLYSNYLDHPENIDINHQLNLVMQINKYISANLGLHSIYDDNMSKEIQFKEVFGIGLNYKF